MSLCLRVALFTAIFMLTACSLSSPKFNFDPGLPGCVVIRMENVTGGPVHVDKMDYHRVNGECKDVVPHPVTP